MPPQPKHHSRRARQNKASTRRTLQPATDRLQDLLDHTVPELKDQLRAQNLPLSGRKIDMARRLAYKDLPPIPGDWHPMAVKFWDDIWKSPMSPEWDESDIHNAYLLALLWHDFWSATSPTGRGLAASEIRLQRQSLGLDPLARRKLEWTIEGAEEAKARGDKRRASEKPTPVEPTQKKTDPRNVFKVHQGGAGA